MSFWKKCPLLAAVIVSGLVIEGAGVANGVKSGEIENPASWKQPALATVFIDLKQGVYPWSDRSVQTAAMDAADVQKDRITEETGGQANEGNGGEKAGQTENADRDADHKNGTGDENEAGVSGNAMPGKAAEETQEAEEEPLEFTHVDKEYFADAVFIGDSRTVGLSEYGKLGNADVFADTGMSVYNVTKKALPAPDGEKHTLDERLQEKNYQIILLMLGINELGYDRNVSYKRYAELVEHIRELQPDAWIVLEANLHVTQAQSEKDDIFNNENINQVNENIRQLAQENGLGYLDVNVLFDDENGCLKADCSADGAHVLGSYYDDWSAWILQELQSGDANNR